MRYRCKKTLLILISLLFLFSCSKSNQEKEVTNILPNETSFSITFLDVGNGDSMVIECDKEYMLLDGGKPSKSNLVYSYLKRNNISNLKYIGCTHPDSDHIGGLAGALQYASAENVLIHADNYEDIEEFNDFIKYIDKDKTNIIIAEKGENYKLGSANIEVLAPVIKREGDNNNSLVLKITYGNNSFLLMGDAEIEEEQDILELNIKSDLIKIAHHGSHSSTSEELLDKVNPSIAVISCGGNSYGHPHIETLKVLKDRNIKLYRTDLHGDIKCSSDGKTITCSPKTNTTKNVYSKDEDNANKKEEIKNLSEYTYIGNSSSMKFHKVDCESIEDIKKKNKIYFNETRDEIIKKGYKPCKKCNP